MTCKLLGFLNQTFSTVFTATAPVYGGTGQQIYYTDVSGTIYIPSSITSLAPLVNATQASADITVNLRLTNASPPNLVAYKDTIKNITFPPGGQAVVRIPPGTGVLPNIGPVTLGQPDVAHRILLGDVSVTVHLQDASGNGKLFPIQVTCGKQDVDYIIGSVNVNSTTGLAPIAPALGYVPDFQPTAQQQESGYFRFPYACNFGPLGPQDLDLIIGGTIPTYLAPGQQFYLSNADSFLRIPSSLISLAKQAFPNAKTFDTSVTNFDILFQNAQPNSFNVAKNGLKSSVPVPDDATKDLVLPIPYDGFLNVGPVTAGANGQIVSVAVGTANATTQLSDASGANLFSFPVDCQVPSPLELIGVPITSTVPGNYSFGIKQN